MKSNGIAMFEELCLIFAAESDIKILPESLRTDILQYSTGLENECERYFPELNGDDFDFVNEETRSDYQPKKFRMNVSLKGCALSKTSPRITKRLV